jgi:HJR/Mrr/RecB family endonuclease
MDNERIHHILKSRGVVTADLFCTVHGIDGDRIVTLYSSHPQPEHLGGWQSDSIGVVSDAAKRSTTNLVSDVASYASYVHVYPNIKSEFAIPITFEGKSVGVINFESTQISYFDQIQDDYLELAEEIARYFYFTKIVQKADILVPQSSLITPESSGGVQVALNEISDFLLRELARRPKLMHDLTPRKFEELLARLLTDSGYSVTLTPAIKDGGRDILALINLPTGQLMTIVECKKWSHHRPVPVEVVRNVYGVVTHDRASHAMIATTSRFTREAKQFQDAIKYQMSLKDYNDIANWLRRYI